MRELQKEMIRDAGYNYLLFLPRDYEKKDSWPLILFLHGAGERGRDLQILKRHGIPRIVEERDDFPFIAVSPQCPQGQYWVGDILVELLDEVEARYRVDKDRIYLTGISMGGYGTWELAIEQPERFAAIAPVCGGGNFSLACRIKDLPIWAFHGALDWVVPITESGRMINAVKMCGGNPKFTIYPNLQHDSWTVTYQNPQLFEWLLSHSKGAPASG